jgi:hypothetical protein
MFKKKHDLHYPYTYGETSSLDVFSWFKILSITTFALFFLTVFYNDIYEYCYLSSTYSNKYADRTHCYFAWDNLFIAEYCGS